MRFEQKSKQFFKINVNTDEGDWEYTIEFANSKHSVMALGQGLDVVIRMMLQNITAPVDRLKPPSKAAATLMGDVQWPRMQ